LIIHIAPLVSSRINTNLSESENNTIEIHGFPSYRDNFTSWNENGSESYSTGVKTEESNGTENDSNEHSTHNLNNSSLNETVTNGTAWESGNSSNIK
jgi:hypothetical protein